MACNCATKEQINELYRRYGRRKDGDRKLTPKEKVKNAVVYAGIVLALIPILPVLFLFVLYKALISKDHRISMTKFFRLDKKVKQDVGQQVI